MTDIVHPKKDMLLFAIGNLMGLQEFVNLGLLEQGIKEIMKEARVTFAYNLPLPSRTPQSSHLSFWPLVAVTKICKTQTSTLLTQE